MEPWNKPNSESRHAAQAAPVAPLFISSMNCRDVVGQTWRWTRTIAKQLGVPLITPPGSSKTLIAAQALIEALDRAGKLREPNAPAAPEPGSADELDAMRQRLGVRRIGGVR